MDLNATLFLQCLVFGVFIWFCVRYVWPPITKVMEERRESIAQGLAAAEKGQRDLEFAERRSKEVLLEAKKQAASLVEEAHLRSTRIVEEGKERGRKETERLVGLAQEEVDQVSRQAREVLMQSVSHIAVLGAEKILQREINQGINDDLVKALVSEID